MIVIINCYHFLWCSNHLFNFIIRSNYFKSEVNLYFREVYDKIGWIICSLVKIYSKGNSLFNFLLFSFYVLDSLIELAMCHRVFLRLVPLKTKLHC